MRAKLNENCRLVLKVLAEYRILTANQLAILMGCHKQVARRYLRILSEADLVRTDSRGRGRSRGRPERITSLTDHGVDLLRSEGILRWEVSNHHVTMDKLRNLEHQILLNWFLVHLVYLEKKTPKLSVRFLAGNSPFLQRNSKGQSPISDYAPVASDSSETVRFTPDAVWSLEDKERGRTFLFFLEVDMGTESIVSPQYNMNDIQQKVLNYGACFDGRRYKRYEQIWGGQFNGFRLLFLTHTIGRLSALCNLVREIPNTDFVWLTEQHRLFEHGVSDNIWARGGHIDTPPESILGRLACPMPIPD